MGSEVPEHRTDITGNENVLLVLYFVLKSIIMQETQARAEKRK